MSNLVQFPGLGLELNIDRVAFSLGNMPVYWYGLLISLGLVLALVFAFRYAADFGIDSDRFVDVVLIGTVCAVICARIYYVVFSPVPYDSIWDMINIRNGGIAIYGAVIGAAIFGGLACKWRRIPMLATFDLVSMGFLIGQGIGRWGNFVNQEAFGANTTLPWGMYSESTKNYLTYWQAELASQGVVVDPTMPVHPTFLYESIWCLVGFFALWAYMKKRRFNGEIALLYAAWYGAGRFWIEGLRTDSLMVAGLGLRVSQVVALVSVVAALVLIVVLRKKYKGIPLMVEPPVPGAVIKKIKAMMPDGSVGLILKPLSASAPHSEFVAAVKEIEQMDFEEHARKLKELREQAQQNAKKENAAGIGLIVGMEELEEMEKTDAEQPKEEPTE